MHQTLATGEFARHGSGTPYAPGVVEVSVVALMGRGGVRRLTLVFHAPTSLRTPPGPHRSDGCASWRRDCIFLAGVDTKADLWLAPSGSFV